MSLNWNTTAISMADDKKAERERERKIKTEAKNDIRYKTWWLNLYKRRHMTKRTHDYKYKYVYLDICL